MWIIKWHVQDPVRNISNCSCMDLMRLFPYLLIYHRLWIICCFVISEWKGKSQEKWSYPLTFPFILMAVPQFSGSIGYEFYRLIYQWFYHMAICYMTIESIKYYYKTIEFQENWECCWHHNNATVPRPLLATVQRCDVEGNILETNIVLFHPSKQTGTVKTHIIK